jgi:hypothetical protein
LPFCSVADPRLEELLELGGLPALLVLLDIVLEFAPRALFDLIVGKAKLDVHFGSRLTETTPLYKDGARTSLERLRRRRWAGEGSLTCQRSNAMKSSVEARVLRHQSTGIDPGRRIGTLDRVGFRGCERTVPQAVSRSTVPEPSIVEYRVPAEAPVKAIATRAKKRRTRDILPGLCRYKTLSMCA